MLGDFNRLQQVVTNLLTNAVKFTPSGGSIEVWLEAVREGGLALIQVKDTGKGIKREFLPHIFEYFRQEDSSTTRQFGGLGLGLAIVSNIVEMHNGTVTADSAGEGQGATFSIKLPIIPSPILLDDSNLVPEPGNIEGVKILIVDDEPDTREFMRVLLEISGADVTVATSALDALTKLIESPPDVLISDLGMPEMDGYQ